MIDIVIDEAGDDRDLTELKLGYDLDAYSLQWKRKRKERMGETYIRGWLQQLQV